MRSISSIFVARAFCELCLVMCLAGGSLAVAAENYSLWPRRPEALQKVGKLVAEGKAEEASRLLEPLIVRKDVIGQEARDMLGALRIREILDPARCPSELYTVKRGDSWISVSSKTKCPLDFIMHLNQFSERPSLVLGQKLRVKALDYRLVVNIPSKELSVWDGNRFIKAYPIMMMRDVGGEDATLTVKSKNAVGGGKDIRSYSPEFAAADKQVVIGSKGKSLVIDTSKDGKMNSPGVYLRREDCNEVALLVRQGNTVEIVNKSKS